MLVMKVMVVEDERDIREILRTLLESEGFEVKTLEDGLNVVEEIRLNSPDLILLDQMLPGKSGTEVVREVRAHQLYAAMPIIMVTGLSGEEDKVTALELGADDYITKPFFPKELAARVKALARRSTLQSFDTDSTSATTSPLGHDRIERNGIVMDFTAHRIWVGSEEAFLTLTEFKILSELLKQSNQVLTRERLRERALGNLNVTDRTIDVHMASLRKKLGAVGDGIETVRGVGYRFTEN
jgi:two-component system, OmpR family, alkaline phosphatase synthesis response regulator PhoP